MTYKEEVHNFVDDIISGRKPAGELVIMSCRRYLEDIKNAKKKGFYFDEKAANIKIGFIELLWLTKGEKKRFKLEPWQKFIIWNLFGWKWKATGYRRFREAYIEIPKKNGKTALGAAVAVAGLVADNELGAEVYAAAFTRDQARICYDESRVMLKHLAEESDYIRSKVLFRTHYIKFGERNKMEAVSHDANNTEGKHSHVVIFDEWHVHKNDGVKNSLRSGMAARTQPLFFAITTAGSNRFGPCYEYRQNIVVKVLQKQIENEHVFGMIYTIDKGDDWQDPKVWEKANPNFGVTITEQSLMPEYQEAKHSGIKEVDFRTKHLNQWTDSAVTWISGDVWDNSEKVLIEHNFPVTYGGLDVAVFNDFTSYSEMSVIDGKIKWTQWAWTHEEKYKELINVGIVSMAKWRNNGNLFVNEGNCIDLAEIRAFINKRSEVVNLAIVAADQAYTGNLFTDLDNDGINMVKISQSSKALTPFIRDFEAAIKKKELYHENNEMLQWMVSNVLCMVKGNNIVITKQNVNAKIDGIMTGIFAYAAYQVCGQHIKGEPNVMVW